MAKMNWGRVKTETTIRRYGSEQIEKLPAGKRDKPIDGICPKCARLMDRRTHPAGWKPDPRKAYHFSFWHYCHRCKHTQLYEKAKVFHRELPPIPAETDDIALSVLEEMAEEKQNYSGPAPWE